MLRYSWRAGLRSKQATKSARAPTRRNAWSRCTSFRDHRRVRQPHVISPKFLSSRRRFDLSADLLQLPREQHPVRRSAAVDDAGAVEVIALVHENTRSKVSSSERLLV